MSKDTKRTEPPKCGECGRIMERVKVATAGTVLVLYICANQEHSADDCES